MQATEICSSLDTNATLGEQGFSSPVCKSLRIREKQVHGDSYFSQSRENDATHTNTYVSRIEKEAVRSNCEPSDNATLGQLSPPLF
jgi:hypothetical protein